MSRGADVMSRGIYGRHQRQEHCQCNDFCSFIHYDYIFFPFIKGLCDISAAKLNKIFQFSKFFIK